MAWCPVCKCEYKEGIEKCADCKVDLVAALDDVSSSEEEEMLSAMEEMAKEMAEELANEEADEEASEEAHIEMPKMKVAKVYQDSAELSSENKSSAYILLSVGIIGIVVLVLICLDVIPIYKGVTSKIITTSVMGTLFVVFVVMGIVSLKNAKKFQQKAAEEGDLSKEIMTYCLENLSAKNIDESLVDEQWDDTQDEVKYFKRIEYIKMMITKQFMNLEEEYVDFICDEVYTKLYEE